jgi:hypothetical protein
MQHFYVEFACKYPFLCHVCIVRCRYLEDDYSTVACKEFLRVMQLNSAHLNGGFAGEEEVDDMEEQIAEEMEKAD